ncbi:MAG: hypothetical protein LJE57_06640 [Gallionella sp.]|nr:hypothetical protein [Gallionella sp.]
MKSVHLVIPDLFLPGDIAAGMSSDLRLPCLERLLGRGCSADLAPVALETLLCRIFGLQGSEIAPVAAVSAQFDGLVAGCWLRADPVHLRLQRDRVLMLANPDISADEAGAICASLNQHFAGQGMEFFAPHPQRWYVRLEGLPDIQTRPVSQLLGGDVRGSLPEGADAPRWHQLLNEMQMLLYAHPLNDVRSARSMLEINSLCLWGAADSSNLLLKQPYDAAISDDVLVEMFAAAAGIPCSRWTEQWQGVEGEGAQLLVWTGLRTALQNGDLAAWRNALLTFEAGYAKPLWDALRSGKISDLRIDIPGREGLRRVELSRRDTWKIWRKNSRLEKYSPA